MHATPPEHPPPHSATAPPPAEPFGQAGTVDVNSILHEPAPAPAAEKHRGGGMLRRAKRSGKAALPHAPKRQQSAKRHGSSKGSSGPSATKLLLWGVVATIALGFAAMESGIVQMQRPDDGGPIDKSGGSERDDSWSYYHDRDYESDLGAAKWDTDRTRSSDPAEAALGDTTRWEYDGPYAYGPYGSDGMRQRASGRDTADPLYSSSPALDDVFSQAGDLDPSGGEPVGAAPSSLTSPYYDPYAGYSNPYSNRIRLAYGEGLGRGANADFTP